MDTRSVGTILLRVAGIVLIAISVAQLPAYFPLMGRGSNWSVVEALGAAAMALGPLAIFGVGLWFFPGTVANRIVTGPPAPGSTFDARPIEMIALTVLGLYLLVGAFVDVTRDVVYSIAIQRQNPETLLPAAVMARMAAGIVQLLAGAWLCIGASGVSRVIERLRGAS